GATEQPPDDQAGKDWSQNEVRLIVADYFDMLEGELLGKPYKKSEHRKALAPQLSGRSKGSIEFKHQNISAVLVERGLPYIEGYNPRGNYQDLLGIEVDAFLDERQDFVEQLAKAPALNPDRPPDIAIPDLTQIIESPPEQMVTPKELQKPWLSKKARKI